VIKKTYDSIIQKANSVDFSMLDDSELFDYFNDIRPISSGFIPESFAIIREVFDRRLGIWRIFDRELKDTFDDIQSIWSFVYEKRKSMGDSRIHLEGSFYEYVRNKRRREDSLMFIPYDVQLIGALALYDGKIAEMLTGEGKTVIAVFASCLWAKLGKKVHIATVNDYLALRDCKWMSPVYEFLSFRVDCVLSYMTDAERRISYDADIVYGNNYEFGFDYLRDNLKYRLTDRVQGRLDCIIIDEIDSILMDEATTPLVISEAPYNDYSDYWKLKETIELLIEKQSDLVSNLLQQARLETDTQLKYIMLIQISKADPWNRGLLDYLNEDESMSRGMDATLGRFATARSEYKLEDDLYYVIDEKHRTVKLTDNGINMIEQQLGEGFMTYRDADFRGEALRNLLQLLKAYTLFRKDEDYVVNDGSIVIVDESTGRLAYGKKYEDGLHQAIECKEGLQVTSENRITGRITHTNYVRLYEKVSGMTATAHTEADEFKRLYNLDVVRIPPNKPVIRFDLPDMFFKTEDEKLEGVVDEIKEYHKFGRPILAGTRSVEKSEHLSDLLKQSDIPHRVLNARNHSEEADIIRLAGEPYAVTVATNMAGRGTDIALGRNLYQIVLENYIEYFKKEAENHEIRINTYSQIEHEMITQRIMLADQLQIREIADSKNVKKVIVVSARPTEEKNVVSARLTEERIGDKKPGVAIDFGLGLHVIGTERHSARRIDDQLKGRSGRQGDPGSSRFYMSLEDELFRVFSDSDISGQIYKMTALSRKIQRRSEEMSYESRKTLIEYDDIMDKQRKAIYCKRLEILKSVDADSIIYPVIEEFTNDLMSSYFGTYETEPDLHELERDLYESFGVHILNIMKLDAPEIKSAVLKNLKNAWDSRREIFGDDFSIKLVKVAMIDALDSAWSDYLSFHSEFDNSMMLRSYVRDNIKTEYRLEANRIFNELHRLIRSKSLKAIFGYPIPVRAGVF